MSHTPHARTLAVTLLVQVLKHHRSLSEVLDSKFDIPDTRDRAFVQALCYTVLRFYPRYQAILDPRLAKPFKAKDFDLYLALICGICQLLDMRVAEHAALADTVEIARQVGKPWAVGLLNGVLRGVQRTLASCQTAWQDAQPSIYYAHPAWWLERWQRDWPDHWQSIAKANLQPPPMTLRVNGLQSSVEDYLAQLHAVGLEAERAPHTTCGIILREAVEVSRLPGFAQGQVSVQDGAAQLAAPLLECAPGMRVLDACAAPGGKLAHILEMYPDCQVWAVEQDHRRVGLIHDTLQRLRLSAVVKPGDASEPATWWDGQLFDRILLDVPCSACGVIRRHPDIKYLRRLSDIAVLAATQQKILQNVWPLLAPSGRIVYVTCSILDDENTQQIVTFVQQTSDAEIIPIQSSWGIAQTVGRQVLPGQQQMDGFYYACLRKNH